MFPTINMQSCTSCGECVRVCVSGVLRVAPGQAAAPRPDTYCIRCGHCVAVCPAEAVEFPQLGESPELGPLPSPEQIDALVATRRSVRYFRPDSVDRETLEEILRVAGQTPSGCNKRGVTVTAIENPEFLQRIERQMDAFARPFTRIMNYAPVQALLSRSPFRIHRQLADPALTAGGRQLLDPSAPQRPWATLGAPVILVFHAGPDGPTPKEDCIIVADQVSLLAQARGLGTCWNGVLAGALAGFPPFRRRLGLPRDHRIHAVLSLGHPAVTYRRGAPRKPIPVRYV